MNYSELIEGLQGTKSFTESQPLLLRFMGYKTPEETKVVKVITANQSFYRGPGKYWSMLVCEILIQEGISIDNAKKFCYLVFKDDFWNAKHKGFTGAFFNANNIEIIHQDDAFAFGMGIVTQNEKGEDLEVFYSQPILYPSDNIIAALSELFEQHDTSNVYPNKTQMQDLAKLLDDKQEYRQSELAYKLSESTQPLVITLLSSDSPPSSVPEGYLKLHLLSHRLVKPHGTNLIGLFGILPNVAWTNQGAIDLEELPERQLQARLNGELLTVDSVDKFPKMTNYVVPSGVRIADTDRVRLGAHIGEGTTIMHEGCVNFNAGTLGTSMIEGRISAGVVVREGSDLGGGSSTMGTLSGGGNIVISVGKESLLGANAGIGIPLGDRCTVESGLYITAGTKVNILDDSGQLVETIKARNLSGKHDLLFRRNSQNGVVECLTNKTAIALNEELHANN